jgi:RND family efflux transporter MFP subunit
MSKKHLRIALPIIILLVGITVTFALISNRKLPRSKKMPQEKVTLVRTIAVKKQDQPVQIHSTATTQSTDVLIISSEIKGKIVWVNEHFVEGGRIDKNEPVFKINPADYALMVEQAQSTLVKAENDLIIVEGKQNASIKERDLFQKSNSDFKMPRANQWNSEIQQAKSTLGAAKANYRTTELNLQRTTVYAPFRGYVRSAKISIGQFVNGGQSVGEIVKDRPVILKVLLPLSDLAWIKLASTEADVSNQGSPVVVSKEIGNRMHKWIGYVNRQLREMDNMGKMATVIIEVQNISSDHGFILPFGLFVDVIIQGNELKNIISIPHEALRSNSTVWQVTEENRLAIQTVSIIRKNNQNYFITNGLKNDDQIVTSNIQAAVPGMKLGIFDETAKKGTQQKNRSGEKRKGNKKENSGGKNKKDKQ